MQQAYCASDCQTQGILPVCVHTVQCAKQIAQRNQVEVASRCIIGKGIALQTDLDDAHMHCQ